MYAYQNSLSDDKTSIYDNDISLYDTKVLYMIIKVWCVDVKVIYKIIVICLCHNQNSLYAENRFVFDTL